MRKNKIILGAAVIVLFTSLLAIALADENETGNAYGKNNMTYGKCVAAAAKIKQACYNETMRAQASCKTSSSNAVEPQTAFKHCRNYYKEQKKQCKTDFKATKKQECAKIKHNFLETVGAAFY
jgi:hypothetical protein